MSTLYSIGQMNQLGDALEAAGFSVDDVTKLRSFPDLSTFKNVLKGHAQIVQIKHVIDCDSTPFLPSGWKGVEEHKKGGQLEWDPTKVYLHLSPNQKDGKSIVGHELRKELTNEPVLNANVLDYLLAHQDLIPESWKGKYVFFWDTIYRDSDDFLYVRSLYWSVGRWRWSSRWLDDAFCGSYPAARSQVSS